MTCISTQSFLRPQRLFSLTSPEENSMLKICFSETPAEERWILHGWLTDPWVHELRTCWRKNQHVDRKSTRLNSSHQIISYSFFCLKKNAVNSNTTDDPKPHNSLTTTVTCSSCHCPANTH